LDGQQVRGEELLVQHLTLLAQKVDQGVVFIMEGGEGVDLAALVCFHEPPNVLGISSMVELAVGPLALGICQGILEGLGGRPSCRASGGCAGCGVGHGAHLVPPSDPMWVEGSVGLKHGLAGTIHHVFEVSEGRVEVQCGYRLSAQSIMIQMLGLNPP